MSRCTATIKLCAVAIGLFGCSATSGEGSAHAGSSGVGSGGSGESAGWPSSGGAQSGGSGGTGTGSAPSSGGAQSGGGAGTTGGSGSGGSSAGFAPSCPASCPDVSSGGVLDVPTLGPVTDQPAPEQPDLNIKLRGWEPCAAVGCGDTGNVVGFVQISPDSFGVDTKAPRLHTLFDPPAHPFQANFQMYDWDWSCGAHGCKGGLVSGLGWDVTAVTFSTSPGQILKLPESGYEIALGGLQARALYVDGDSVSLKYTGEDNVVVGYALSIVGICPAPDLRAAYDADEAAGRSSLPALHAGDAIGTACADRTLVTIRDSGSFMDPRSETDWWQGHP